MKKHIIVFLCALTLAGILSGCSWFKEKEITGTKPPAATSEPKEKEERISVVNESKAQDYAETILKDMSLDEKIGQMIMVDLSALNGKAPSKDSKKKSAKKEKKKAKKSKKSKKKKAPEKEVEKPITKVSDEMKDELQKYPVGGIVLQTDNMKDSKQTIELIRELQASVSYYPMYIATTEEWGGKSVFAENKKLGGSAYPMLSEISMTKSMEEIYTMGKNTGSSLKDLGINFNLAPVADVSDGLKNAQYAKYCFSDDEDEVSEYIENAVKGMRVGGVCTALTHFPGVGSIVGDYKSELVDNDSGLTHLRDVDLVPFSAGIGAETDAIMVSHITVSKVTQNDTPASMSELIITGILRDELNYDGLIMTDSMNTPVITKKYEAGQAALQAIQAGADMILQPADLDAVFTAIRAAVANRSLDEKVLNEAVIRILKNKIQRGIIQIDTAMKG